MVLQDRVSKILLKKYDELLNTGSFIPCEKSIHLISDITWHSWKERLLVERLQAKTNLVLIQQQENNNHWEETMWWLLARNFGMVLNADAFEKMARSISMQILARHKQQIHHVEALLFGQAGLLEKEFEEEYPRLLQKEYVFLKKKYNLSKPHISLVFLRMRPGNFPTVRLAQLAMLVHQSQHLFSKLKETDELEKVKDLLSVTANDYWHYHYVFDETSAFRKKKLGSQMADHLLINTVIPVLFAYGHQYSENRYKEKAIRWLEELKAEVNSITKGFSLLRCTNKTAFDSQGFIHLKNEYCNKKRCLDCSIGSKLLRDK
jgi:uncharacterized protein DUF2851